MSQTATKTATYTVADIEKVVTRVRADLIMIADSTGAWTGDTARTYAHDIEELAKEGYLSHVDVTLLNGASEVKAVRYTIKTDASGWTSTRPGGVCWPRVANPRLRVILFYNDSYDDEARRKMDRKLKLGWSPTSEDTSHSGLSRAGGRDYASNGYGMQRMDWAA